MFCIIVHRGKDGCRDEFDVVDHVKFLEEIYRHPWSIYVP